MAGGPAFDPHVLSREADGSQEVFPGSLLSPSPRMVTLRQRREFLRVAHRGRKVAMPGLVLQAAARPSASGGDGEEIGVGFTVSRKVGKAVTRNRAKRRLREVARHVLPVQARPGTDYVLIGRRETVERPFHLLQRDLERALAKLSRTVSS